MAGKTNVLHVDMDAFFASVERNRRNLEGPIVVCVYSGRSKDSGAVSTCSYDARELGIHAAMPIVEAKSIAEESVKEVSFVEMNREYYREISDQIREEILEKYAEKVEEASIDEAYLQVDKNIDGAVETAERIQEEVERDFDLTCSIGVAPNKLVAKIASDREKPAGITVVRPEEVEDFMKSLELGDIHGIGSKTVEKLGELGIDSVKELMEANEAQLVREFGEKLGLKLKKKAKGVDSSEVEKSEQKQFTRIRTLGENSSSASYIKKYFPALSRELMEKIESEDLAFGKVGLVVVDSDLEIHTRISSLKSRVSDQETIVDQGEKLLEEFLDEFEGEVRRVGLRVKDLEDTSSRQRLDSFTQD